MTKRIDPRLVELLKHYGEDHTSVWDCHGTWVAYHAAIERMAAKAGVVFNTPEMIVNDYEKKTVVVCVAARMGEATEWSFGEVSPANNKNSYPYAMAEKRAKDRVALKLLGMAGLVYSEEEADDFKAEKPVEPQQEPVVKSSAQLKRERSWETIVDELELDMVDVRTLVQFETLKQTYREKVAKEGWPPAWKYQLKDKLEGYENEIRDMQNNAAEDETVSDIQDQFPGAKVTNVREAAE